MRGVILCLMILTFTFSSIANADEQSRRASAEELLRLTRADQMMEPLFGQMQIMMEKQFIQMGVSEDLQPILKRYEERLFKALTETFNWQSMKNDFVSVYAETFTEQELEGIVAFYKTPVGQALINKMPILMSRSMEVTQKRLPEITDKMKGITAKLIEEMKAEVEKRKKEQQPPPPLQSGS